MSHFLRNHPHGLPQNLSTHQKPKLYLLPETTENSRLVQVWKTTDQYLFRSINWPADPLLQIYFHKDLGENVPLTSICHVFLKYGNSWGRSCYHHFSRIEPFIFRRRFRLLFHYFLQIQVFSPTHRSKWWATENITRLVLQINLFRVNWEDIIQVVETRDCSCYLLCLHVEELASLSRTNTAGMWSTPV